MVPWQGRRPLVICGHGSEMAAVIFKCELQTRPTLGGGRGRWLSVRVQGQPGLQSKFQAIQGSTMRSYHKHQNKTLSRPCLDTQEITSTQPISSQALSNCCLLASCNFCGPKCLRQLYPGKDCPNEWVCLKLKRVPKYHMASHHSGFPGQGLSRQIFLEAYQGSQQMKASEMTSP